MSGPSDWHTPRPIVEVAVNVLGGIDLDPCADAAHNIPANQHFTILDDGLIMPWHARSVYVNPPYGHGQIEQWLEKGFSEYGVGHVDHLLYLLPAATDTGWFQLVWEYASAVCFLRGRLKFIAGIGQHVSSNKTGSVLVYIGHEPWRLLAHATHLGKVVLL